MVTTIGLLLLALTAFLVAALLLRRRNDRKARRWNGFEAAWGTLMKAAYEGRATSADVKSTIAAGEELFFVDFLYKQALQVRDPERRAVLRQLATPYLPLITTRTRGGDPERRARAVKTLAELGGAHHTRYLIAALDDPSSLVSMSAARGLARAAGAGGVREIVARVDRYGDWNRRYLRATLAQLGLTAVPALRSSAQDAGLSPSVRAVCLETLGELEDAGSTAIAEEILWTQDDVDLCAAALRLLRRCGTAEHALTVRNLCYHDDPVIRAQAVGTLAKIGEDADAEVLESALKDPSAWVALHAARGLKSRGRVRVLEEAVASAGPTGATGLALQVLREEV
jgi:HEAT repeat protein